MGMEYSEHNDDVELRQGDYWKATSAIPEHSIPLGRILLLQSIRMAEDRVHTIVLYPHPETNFQEHRFLVQDFIKKFIPVTEQEASEARARELGVIQQKVLALQNEVVTVLDVLFRSKGGSPHRHFLTHGVLDQAVIEYTGTRLKAPCEISEIPDLLKQNRFRNSKLSTAELIYIAPNAVVMLEQMKWPIPQKEEE
jgi:hypothetical protein